MSRWLKKNEIETLYQNKEKFRVKCKCGHTNTILNKNGYKVCNWCKNYVFLNPKIEFEFRMKEKLLEEKRNLK